MCPSDKEQTLIPMGDNAAYVCPVCKNYVLITSAVKDIGGFMKHEQCTIRRKNGKTK